MTKCPHCSELVAIDVVAQSSIVIYGLPLSLCIINFSLESQSWGNKDPFIHQTPGHKSKAPGNSVASENILD